MFKGKGLRNFLRQGNLISLEVSTSRSLWNLPFPYIKNETHHFLRLKAAETLELSLKCKRWEWILSKLKCSLTHSTNIDWS